MAKVSVITVVYNRRRTIGQAIRSVNSQTWKNTEHLIVDGGSDDGTLEEIAKHKSSCSVCISEPDTGIYDALNKGLKLATGDVVGLMHSDDFYAESNVLEQISNAFDDPDVDAVYGDLDYVSADNPSNIVRKWRSGEYDREKVGKGWMPPHPTLYLRRSLVEKLGGFDTTYKIAADYDFILRYFWHNNPTTIYIPKVLVKMRAGGVSNSSFSRIIKKSGEDLKALRKNKVGGIRVLARKNLSKVRQFVS